MIAAGEPRGVERAWARSLLLVIPLIAAIFLMHGVQCGGDDHGTEHTLMALAAPQTRGTVDEMGHAVTSGHGAAMSAAGAALAAVDVNEPTLRNIPGTSPLSPAGVCLVLLTAGLVLILIALRSRRRPVPGRDPGATPRAGPPVPAVGPPSLSQLCLLRI